MGYGHHQLDKNTSAAFLYHESGEKTGDKRAVITCILTIGKEVYSGSAIFNARREGKEKFDADFGCKLAFNRAALAAYPSMSAYEAHKLDESERIKNKYMRDFSREKRSELRLWLLHSVDETEMPF